MPGDIPRAGLEPEIRQPREGLSGRNFDTVMFGVTIGSGTVADGDGEGRGVDGVAAETGAGTGDTVRAAEGAAGAGEQAASVSAVTAASPRNCLNHRITAR
jgi:hypothetical protein